MSAYFDIVAFLGLPTESANLRQAILKDLALFLLAKFADGLTETQLDQVRNQMNGLKGYEEVMQLIYRFDPEFETKKIKWLDEYKKNFKLDKFK